MRDNVERLGQMAGRSLARSTAEGKREMPIFIHILIVEDAPDDAELEILQLEQCGFAVEWRRVQTAAEFLAALAATPYDLILADYGLPTFTGLDALHLLQAHGYDIPFILISSASGEEAAVACMKEGAADYLRKDRLARLGSSVQHALHTHAARKNQRRTEAALAASEENYRLLFDQAIDGIFIANADGHYLDANVTGCQMLGYTRDEVLRLSVRDVVDPDDVARRPLRFPEMNAGKPAIQQRRMRRKDGTVFVAEITGKKLPDGRIQGIVRDATERIAIEEALQQSEEHYRAIVEVPFAQICRWRPDTTLTYVNEAYAHAYGIPAHELIGMRWIRFLPAEEREEVLRAYAKLEEQPTINTLEHQVVEADGNLHWLLWTDYPIFDGEGRLVEFQSIGQDVTKHRRVEQQVRLLSRAVEQSPVSIVLTDREGTIEYVNPCFEKVTGYAAAEVIGQNPRILRSGETPPEAYKVLWETILAGREWRGEFHNRKKNGELYWESALIAPVTDSDGAITHLLAVKEDITARKAADAELHRLNEELEERVEIRTAELRTVNLVLERTARAKDEFLASMSHELRTPLSGILGVAEGLQEQVYGPLNDRQLRALGAVRESSDHLLGLINDVLDMSKVEAGQLTIQMDLFSVADICQSSLRLIRGMSQKKRHRVSFTMEPPAITLEADARRLKQMLVNLLSNAVKFTPEEGRIGLEVEAQEATASVRFTVWDTGIGILPTELPKLFQPFTQVDSSLSREYAGTGLGLSLVRSMAELHGGGVVAESTPGQGSRFTITLPWRRLAPSIRAASVSEQGALLAYVHGSDGAGSEEKPRPCSLILLADDNEMTIESYREFLEASGYGVAVARRGSEATHLAEELKPALILMDIQMPGMDGLVAMRRIRASTTPGVANTPIIALTALAMPGDRERCLEAGADGYLSKPVHLKELLTSIRSYCALSEP